MPLGDVVHERNGIRFTWDRGKADLNLRKHGVSFETACEIFFDPLVRLLRSEMLGGEDRETAIGMTESWNVLVVVYTFRKEAIRIISARPATPRERDAYED
ncbi:MAG TPA: BrnT family toxin [Thermoanaerobaculia bacterium]|nr:BrnT family toxin [Thermoanaerobaculia bacterium]